MSTDIATLGRKVTPDWVQNTSLCPIAYLSDLVHYWRQPAPAGTRTVHPTGVASMNRKWWNDEVPLTPVRLVAIAWLTFSFSVSGGGFPPLG